MTPSSSLVVVLPFVPVTPRIGFGRSREPSSTSLQTGIPRSRAATTRRRLAGYPWALDHSLDGVEQSLLLGPEMEFDTGLPKPADVQVFGGVDADHLDPAPAQRERGGLPGASEP